MLSRLPELTSFFHTCWAGVGCPVCYLQFAGMSFFFFFLFPFSFCGLSYHLGHATLCWEDEWLLKNFMYFFRDFFLFYNDSVHDNVFNV
jgi:hypothetical protein